MKRGDLGDGPRLREAAGFMMRGVDYGIYSAEGAGDHDGGGVLPWQRSRGGMLESLAWGSRGEGGDTWGGEVRVKA